MEEPKPARAIPRKKSPVFEILRKLHPVFLPARIRDDAIHQSSNRIKNFSGAAKNDSAFDDANFYRGMLTAITTAFQS